jgi:RNA polymerase sigma factor (sigma-70 family)
LKAHEIELPPRRALRNGTGEGCASSASPEDASDRARRGELPRASARASRVPTGPPEAVLDVLRSAHSATHSPRLESVLEAFRKHWLAIGNLRYPQLDDDLEDAVQIALIKLISSDKLATLHEAERIQPWARSIFVHTVLDLLRTRKRHARHRTYLGTPEADPEQALRDALPPESTTPEDLASHRERLFIVARVASKLEVIRIKFVQDLPEKEIAWRQGVTRYSVASQVKRARQALRRALGPD